MNNLEFIKNEYDKHKDCWFDQDAGTWVGYVGTLLEEIDKLNSAGEEE